MTENFQLDNAVADILILSEKGNSSSFLKSSNSPKVRGCVTALIASSLAQQGEENMSLINIYKTTAKQKIEEVSSKTDVSSDSSHRIHLITHIENSIQYSTYDYYALLFVTMHECFMSGLLKLPVSSSQISSFLKEYNEKNPQYADILKHVRMIISS